MSHHHAGERNMVSIHFPTWIPNTSTIITKYNNCQIIIIAKNCHWISIFPDNNNCQVYSIHYCCPHNSIHRLAEMPTLTLISHRLSLDISSPPLIGSVIIFLLKHGNSEQPACPDTIYHFKLIIYIYPTMSHILSLRNPHGPMALFNAYPTRGCLFTTETCLVIFKHIP